MAAESSNHKQQQNQAVGACGNQFFKVLLPDFLKKLYLPPAFCKVISKQKYKDAIIRGPLGKSWHAEVLEDSKGLYFGEGWQDFATAHDLTVGCFLVFKYEGSMDFSVTVFDVSACEKVYAHRQGLISEIKNPVSCSSGLPNAEQPKVRVCEEKKVAKSASEFGHQTCVARNCSKLGPHFRATMKPCNLKQLKPYMNIPAIFRASYDLSNKYLVILRDPEGEKWPVRIYHKRRVMNASMFGSGWEKFHAWHNLKVGDSCVFDIPPGEQHDIMDVHIFRR